MDDEGYHYLLDGVTNDLEFLKDEKALYSFFLRVIKKTRMNILGFMSHKFTTDGQGVTGFFLLSESHLSFHTYPESNYISIDLYTCGQDYGNAIESIKTQWEYTGQLSIRSFKRGKHLLSINASSFYDLNPSNV
ncbi:adenosylmethionine decarboxylase [Bartonella taylorii]|uniref:S-adenosylmethionine decarboxylase proenzyme n=1 Tax=Bartonella taylorii 8TBB TaxID=1094560 RepID=A0A9P2W1S4_BARTA|nr:adenosylmethionine decarboxylase [Bartonella taylorii]EJF92330.1 S-adenosylmethionine decarboxylase proenzyme [Bartonella taylorii 8TBB]USP01432.1 adenosylmethionine decarboxylase [Bartonella taylorii]